LFLFFLFGLFLKTEPQSALELDRNEGKSASDVGLLPDIGDEEWAATPCLLDFSRSIKRTNNEIYDFEI